MAESYGVETVTMSGAEFDALTDYSKRLPAILRDGERWKSLQVDHFGKPVWLIGEFPNPKTGIIYKRFVPRGEVNCWPPERWEMFFRGWMASVRPGDLKAYCDETGVSYGLAYEQWGHSVLNPNSPNFIPLVPLTPKEEPVKPHDPVNHPPDISCMDVIQHFQFNIACAIDCLWHAGERGTIEQHLGQAIWYIQREIERIKKTAPNKTMDQEEQRRAIGELKASIKSNVRVHPIRG